MNMEASASMTGIVEKNKRMHSSRRRLIQKIGFSILILSLIITIFFLFVIVIFVAVRGAGVIDWEFITAMPRKSMTEGGIWPAILGTFYLSLGAVIFALPLGILSAIYLNEYAGANALVRIIKMGIVQ